MGGITNVVVIPVDTCWSEKMDAIFELRNVNISDQSAEGCGSCLFNYCVNQHQNHLQKPVVHLLNCSEPQEVNWHHFRALCLKQTHLFILQSTRRHINGHHTTLPTMPLDLQPPLEPAVSFDSEFKVSELYLYRNVKRKHSFSHIWFCLWRQNI